MNSYSSKFIRQWKEVIRELYSYEEYMDFFVITTFTGSKVLSYLPLLNYTDRDNDNIDDLLELAKNNDYLIKALNPHYTDYQDNDPVTMHLNIGEASIDGLWQTKINKDCRKNINLSRRRYDIEVKIGNQQSLIDEFYKLFQGIMLRHGSPAVDKKLFEIMNAALADINFFVFYYKTIPIAGSIVFVDNNLATLYWNCIDYQYSFTKVGHYSTWTILSEISIRYPNVNVFDFGRSPYGGNTFKFKSGFGATPMKIDLLKPVQDNVYNKYRLASYVWGKLPIRLANYLGPYVCKRIADL
jgi:hypothetical protein